MLRYLTKENITFVLSVIGSLYAFISIINNFYKSRQKFRVDIQFTKITSSNNCIIHFSIENKSSNTLSVYGITLINNNRRLEAAKIPESVYQFVRKRNNVEVFRKEDFSLPIPFTVHPYSIESGYAYFPNHLNIELDPDKPVILEIQTGKKKVFQMKLLL